MNLLEAIRSGRPWKPVGTDRWRDPIERGPGYNELRIELGELFAEYEIQEPTVSVSYSQLSEAVLALVSDAETFHSHGFVIRQDPLGFLARKLGLEEGT